MLKDEVVQGSVEGVYAEEEKEEEALRESEEKFRNVFESANDCIIILDRSGRILDVNGKAVEVFGGSKKEVLGKHFIRLGLFYPTDVPTLMSNFASILAGKKAALNVRIKNKKGQEILLECLGSFMRIGDKLAGIMVIARDVTEKKRTEEALRRSEEKYRSLVELAPDGIATTDMKGVVTSVNTAFSRWTGFSRDELVGKHFTKLGTLRPMDIPKYIKLYSSLLRGKIPPLLEFVYLRKNGTTGWVEAHVGLTKVGDKTVGFNIIARDITERKKTEEALQKSENKYRTLLENVPQKIFFKDRNSVYVSCNENYARDLKINSDEITGRTDFDFYPKKLAEKYRADDKRIMESGKTEDIEEDYIQDGQKVFVHTVKTPVKDENGNVVGILGIFWDVTERKRAEEELIRLSSAVKMSTDSIVISDLNGKIIDANEATLKMYGTDDKRNLIGKNSFDLIAPEEQEKAFAGMKEVLEKGYVKSREYNIVTEDGNKIPVEMSVSIMKDARGKPIGFVGTSRDITERKQMEEKLRQYSEHLEELVQKRTEELLESEKRYSVLVEEAGDGVIILQDGKIVFTNKRAAETIRYSKDEMMGLSLEKLVDEGSLLLAKEMYERNLRGETPTTFEVKWIAKTGERIPFEVSGARIHYHGRPAVLRVARDIRERKRMEEERLRLEKLATVGELATMVGHDLRNPLQSIENAAYYLKNELANLSTSVQISPKTKEMLQVLNDSINYADKIIKDLQDFSSTKPSTLEKADINMIVKEALSIVKTPTNIEIRTELDYLPQIRADKDQMKRVFLNLTTNAIQAMEKGGTLTVSTRKNEGFFEVSFKDTGVGISEESMKKIFTPFLTTRAKGMGMGLSICKKFIEMHGGSIHVESEVGKGTTFTVKLPISQDNGGEKT